MVLCVSQQAACSHVGVPNMAADLPVSSAHNIRHIAETWFSHRKHLVYRINRISSDRVHQAAAAAAADDDDDVDDGGGGGGGARRSTLIPQQTKCRHVDWYLNNVAVSDLVAPSTFNPLQFGFLRVCVCVHLLTRE